MKQSFWGYAAIVLGLVAIVLIWTFSQVNNIDQHNYNLLKETVEASMLDSVDLSAYREDGTVKIIEEKFVENLVRRFAENADLSKNYTIEIYDVNELPPKVSLIVKSKKNSNVKGYNAEFDISNNIDAILESRWSLKTHKIKYSNGGDKCDEQKGVEGETWGELCVPDNRKDYVFDGWYKADGTKFDPSSDVEEDVKLYAKWESWSECTEDTSKLNNSNYKHQTCTLYKTKETKSSKSSTMSGWTYYDTKYEKVDSGSIEYAAFPSGFDTTNSIYKKYNKTPCKASNSGNYRTTVTSPVSTGKYIYYHWCRGENSWPNSGNRKISYSKTSEYYKFHAFESWTKYTYYKNGDAFDITYRDLCNASRWWNSANPNLITVMKCNWTKEQKVYWFYRYSKITTEKPKSGDYITVTGYKYLKAS